MATDTSAHADLSTADMAPSQPPFPASRAHICHALTSLSQQRASAVVTVCGPRRRTGRQLSADVAAMGAALREELGVRRGERVCILGLNSDMYCDALLAVALIGAIPAPLNHRWSLSEAVAAAEGVRPAALVLDAEMAHRWPQLRAAVPSLRCALLLPGAAASDSTAAPSAGPGDGVPSQEGGGLNMDNATASRQGEGAREGAPGAGPQASGKKSSDVHSWSLLKQRHRRPQRQQGTGTGGPPENDGRGLPLQWATDTACSPAIICFTSGTTGRPKGAVLSHEALTFQSLAKLATVGYSQSDVFLHVAPLCHIGGLSSLLAMLMAGGTSVFAAPFSATRLPRLLRDHAVTALIAVPAMLADIIAAQGRGECSSFPCVRTLLVGGGAMSAPMQEKVEDLFPRCQLWTAYGMTEAASSITFHCLRGPQGPQGVGSPQRLQQPAGGGMRGGACAGVPAPHVEMRIASTSGEGQGAMDRVGEVLTRGPHLMSGYWGMPQATAAVLTPDGWFRTGDLGCTDAQGVLWLVGRAKDMIKSGGENVFAPEVEAALCQHAGVEEAAVVGIPDPRLGESVAALLRLKPGWHWEDGRRDAPGTPGDRPSGWGQGSVTGVPAGGQALERGRGHAAGTPEAAGCGEGVGEGARDAPSVSADNLAEFCRQSGLSRFKVPRDFVALGSGEQLPKTSTGKVRKDVVRQLVLRNARQDGCSLAARL